MPRDESSSSESNFEDTSSVTESSSASSSSSSSSHKRKKRSSKKKPAKKPAKKTTKKKKAKKGPKKSCSAYSFFLKQIYPTVKEENPDCTFGERAKLVSKKWKELSADEKKPFLDMAKEDKVRYEKERQKYDEEHGDTSSSSSSSSAPKKRTKRAKKVKDENAPKRPCNTFLLFLQDKLKPYKAEHPDKAHKEVTKELGDQWKKMSDEEKKPYTEKYEENKKKYAKELEAYEASKKK